MARVEVPLVLVLVSGLACGPGDVPGQDGSDATTGDGDGDGDGEPNGCAVERDAQIDAMLVDLQAIVDGAVAYFEAEHVLYECDEPGCAPIDFPLHHCPAPTGQSVAGECGVTPPLELDCNDGPDCTCAPINGGGGPGQYDAALWHVMWAKLGFGKDSPHAFHYNFHLRNETTGYGSCSFTAQAFGDLDDDSIVSTYEIAGTIDENGVTLEPLHVELGDE